MGIQISDDRTLYTLHFANDQVVIAQDKEDLEHMTRKLLFSRSEFTRASSPCNLEVDMHY